MSKTETVLYKETKQTYRLVVLDRNSSISPSLLSVFTTFRENTELPRSQIWPHNNVKWSKKQGGVLKKRRKKKKKEKRRHGWGVKKKKSRQRCEFELICVRLSSVETASHALLLDGIHVRGCTDSQGHFFWQDSDKERKTWVLASRLLQQRFLCGSHKKKSWSAAMPLHAQDMDHTYIHFTNISKWQTDILADTCIFVWTCCFIF